jgi:hypothetical protein
MWRERRFTMQINFKKVFIQILVLLLVVNVCISFAQQPVTITVTKDVIEADFAGFNLYQDADEAPFATINTRTSPGVWRGDIVLTNGKTTIWATAFDDSSNESVPGPKIVFNPPPGAPTSLTVNISIIVGR